MTRARIYLILQAVLCVLLVALLAASAVTIYREGAARKAENPLESIYTREIVAEKLAPIAPLFFAAVALTVAGLALGVRDENADKPVNDAELSRKPVVDRAARPSDATRRARGALQIALIAVAIGLIALGALNGGARDVLYKAINICSECVGLG